MKQTLLSPTTQPDSYVSINEAGRLFGFSRSTFYRMWGDPDSGLDRLVVRIPPGSGRIRVPVRAFEAWLRAKRSR